MTTPIAQLQYLLKPLIPLLEGGTEDIAIQEPGVAWVHRGGRWSRFDIPPLDYDTLLDMTIMAGYISGQVTSERDPLLFTDIPMADGPPLRLMAVQRPAVEPDKISWTLRQPGNKIHSLEEATARYQLDGWNQWARRKDDADHSVALALYDAGDIVAFLRHIVEARYNILLCGATGAGKTTMGITLIDAIPAHERIITLENAREYRMNHPNRVHLLYAQGDQGIAQISQKQLQQASLRMRPDRVLVQELIDGEAAATYVQEVVSGHPGSITTIHGENPAQAFKKLFSLIKSSPFGASQQDATVVSMLASVVHCIMPFHNDASVFSIGKVWFAPEAARRNETIADLLTEIV